MSGVWWRGLRGTSSSEYYECGLAVAPLPDHLHLSKESCLGCARTRVEQKYMEECARYMVHGMVHGTSQIANRKRLACRDLVAVPGWSIPSESSRARRRLQKRNDTLSASLHHCSLICLPHDSTSSYLIVIYRRGPSRCLSLSAASGIISRRSTNTTDLSCTHHSAKVG